MKKNAQIVQSNRLTTARYELNLIEKKIMYLVISEIRKKFVYQNIGNRTLFDDLLVKFSSKELRVNLDQESTVLIRKALRSLRQRSFEWDNGEPVNSNKFEAFEVGYINWHQWNGGGNVEIEISKKLLPFLVALSEQFTEFSLLIVMSLKSKWSQRFYELCSQWRSAGGFYLEIDKMRKMFMLEKKYVKYGALKKNVIDIAYKELKGLFEKNQSDLYFEYNEKKSGRSVVGLEIKVITKKDKEVISLADMDYFVRRDLHRIFDTKNKPKNKDFVIKTMQALRDNPELLKHCYNRLGQVKKLERKEQARYMRFIINEDYLSNKKSKKTKKEKGEKGEKPNKVDELAEQLAKKFKIN